MVNSDFIFLKEEFRDIYDYCQEIEEDIVNQKYKHALSTSRDVIELTIKTIFHKEGIKYPKDLNNAIYTLSRQHVLRPNIVRLYNEIKDAGNYYSHSNKLPGGKVKPREKTPQEEAFNIHHKLYNVISEFYLEYNEAIDPFDVGRYSGINLLTDNKNDDKFDLVMESINDLKQTINSKQTNSEEVIKNDPNTSEEKEQSWLDDYEFNPINDSFLLGQLNKLNDSSREAVEGSESLSGFKRYLHVKRTIEDELLLKLNNAVNSRCKLILVCGSVGDGKSHLIAHFNDEYPDLMDNFKIVKDATESDSYDKTSIDTLMDKLNSFDDDHIDSTDEKLILLINLGVLNNFMHSDNVKEKYSYFLNKLNELSIFDADDFSNVLDNDIISIVSFSDYYIFEFDSNCPNKVKSDYISELFLKITDDNKDNPFYKAYRMDKENKVNNPIIKNYEFFRMSNVQQVIIFNLIKIIIKYKIFISTRELLNFIYEILVPADIINYDGSESPVSYIEYLLPNLLFGSEDRCDVLKAMNYEDPTLKRVELTDNLLVDLNTGMELKELFDKYMDVSDLNFFEDIFDFDVVFTDYKDEDKKIISSSILRFSNIFGNSDIKNVFNKQSYLDYIDYLYHYNRGEQKYLKDLINSIKSAIFKWKGHLPNDYVCIENLNKFKIGKLLKMDFKGIKGIENNELNRFKTSLTLPFYSCDSSVKEIKLNVDYSLYEFITKLVKGYKPNNSEQKDLILFNEFINSILSLNSSNKCIICSHEGNVCFKLNYNETFEEYVFRRAL